jgi:precorrin-6B methylase 2
MSLVAELPAEYRFIPAPPLPRYCTSLVNRLSDFCWEARLGIRTKGDAPSPHEDANRYGYLAFHTYFSIFDRLALTPADVVVDLGCGKGRIVCAAATYDIREAVGVEIDPQLCALAEANAGRLRGRRAPLRIVGESAAEFDYDPVTAIVMFHPFGADTMRQVLDRLQESLARRPRMLRIVYANPALDHLLAAEPWLETIERWNPGTWSRIKFPVYFYRSRA